MNSKTRLISFSAALLFIASMSVIMLMQNSDPRKEYENFLQNEFLRLRPAEKTSEMLKEPDSPEMAALHNYFQTLDPALGRVPLERLKGAYTETVERGKQMHLKSSRDPLSWEIVESNMGGRVRCITFDPNDPAGRKVWGGSVTGGLWHNDDISAPFFWWTPVNDFWPSLSISAIVFDPNDQQTMYVGTGEAFTAVTIYRESSGLGTGILKSTDGGNSWLPLPSTDGFKYITDIEIRDENGTSVIYAGVVSGTYKGAQHQSSPSDGLYRSIDGGQTWIQVLPDIPGSEDPFAVADIEIGEDGRIYVGSMRNLEGDGGATILYSDQGIIGTWTIYDDYVSIIESDPDYYVPGRVMLASAPSDADVVYALIDAGYVDYSDGFTYSRGRYIIRSDNRGASWNYRPRPSGGDYYWATLGWHALTAAVDPNNPEHVYIGGLDVYKSNDGGFTWLQVSDWRGMYYGGGDDYVHADIHDIDFKPGSSDELVVVTDGGAFYTNEATAGSPAFQQKNTLFSTLQFYTCAIHPGSGVDNFLGGLQDNGSLYYTGSPLSIFSMLSGGDGAYCFYDKDQPQNFITSVYYNSYYLFVNGEWAGGAGDGSSGIFINPSDFDSELNTLYANACSYGGDQANYLLRIKNIPYNPQENFIAVNTSANTWFSSVVYSPYSPTGEANLFLGTASGRLYKVSNAQASPSTLEITGDDFPEANISCIAIGGSEDTLLVTFSNYGVSSIWQTRDGGSTWEEKESDLPDMPIRWALYHPQHKKSVMLATETGVWTTDDIDAADVLWLPDNTGLANVRIDMLQLRESDNTVLAATHGRGLAYTTWDVSIGASEEVLEENISLYPNPNEGRFRLSLSGGKNEESLLRIFNAAGQQIHTEKLLPVNGNTELIIDLGEVSPGEYLVNIATGKRIISKKLIIR